MSISMKQNVVNWNSAIYQNKMLLDTEPIHELKTMPQYLNLFLNLAQWIKGGSTHSYMFFGPAQFRFFKTNKYQCVKEMFNNTSLFKAFGRMEHSMECTYVDHFLENRDKSGIFLENLYNYTFLEEAQTGVSHYLSTPLGSYDRSGTVINLNTNK
jgi:hypothetical protein